MSQVTEYKIATIPGDGIGPEVLAEAIKILEKVSKLYRHKFTFIEVQAGSVAIDEIGEPLPKETLKVCKDSDSILLGAVGDCKQDALSDHMKPKRALLELRRALGLYANLCPAILHEPLKEICPLRPDIAALGINIMIVRELTGGIYFGDYGRKDTELGFAAWDTELYTTEEVRRIAITAFDIARSRKSRVTNVDKANILESSRLWREVILEVANDYPDVKLDHMYVDNACMQLIKNPSHFDVIVTTNMFGDILSGIVSQITGSIGMLPSAGINNGGVGIYEPIHGSAPDIAGQNKANPIAAILSAAMMLRYSFGLSQEASAIEKAVAEVLSSDARTEDILSEKAYVVGTKEMGRLIWEAVE